jgi:Resolvase, N terminal domain
MMRQSPSQTRPDPGIGFCCPFGVEPGDTLTVRKLDRLGRSLRNLVTTFYDLRDLGVKLRSLTEAIGTNTAMGHAPWQHPVKPDVLLNSSRGALRRRCRPLGAFPTSFDRDD